jgi:hypothetical protein
VNYALHIIVPTATVMLLFVLVGRRRTLLSPDILFVFSQALVFWGTLSLLDPSRNVHLEYLSLLTWWITALGFSGIVLSLIGGLPRSLPQSAPTILAAPLSAWTWSLVLLSIGISVAYFVAVGYSALWLGLAGLIGGEPVDVATLRLESYAGERYLAAGYVNQFKNYLLPSLSVVIVHTHFLRRARFRWLLALVLGSISVFALVGTGQRGAFTSWAIVVGVYAWLVSRSFFRFRPLMFGLLGVVIFGVVSRVLGRGPEAEGFFAIPGIGLVAESFVFLWDRVFTSNQLAGVAAYEYTSQLPTQFGLDWYKEFVGLLPGRSGLSLSNEVFRLLYGSTRGTAPPTVPGSIHYNFGWIGVITAAVLLMLGLNMLARRVERIVAASPLELIGIAGLIVTLGLWIAGSPAALLNTGVMVYAVLYLVGRRLTSRCFAGFSVESIPRSDDEPVPAGSGVQKGRA